ncbi:MAG: type II toxin-antitoxin system VapC family toxin [Candidatus Korobacteraceae bacterium]
MAESFRSKGLMSNIILLDTSVIVDHLRTRRYQQLIDSVSGLIRFSSVVLAELWRGAGRREEHELLRTIQRTYPILTPTERNWLDSGELLLRIYEGRKLAPSKLRDLHFDVLIALTARSHGARLITSNRADFELINRYRRIQLEIW